MVEPGLGGIVAGGGTAVGKGVGERVEIARQTHSGWDADLDSAVFDEGAVVEATPITRAPKASNNSEGTGKRRGDAPTGDEDQGDGPPRKLTKILKRSTQDAEAEKTDDEPEMKTEEVDSV